MNDAASRLTRAPGVWGHLDSLDGSALIAYATRVEELGYSGLWVPDVVGREPFTLAALLVAATKTITIGTSIVSIWGRGPQTARMAAMTLHEASGGRFVLGLGVSHPHMAGRLHGREYDRPLERMHEYLAAYRAARYTGPGADRGEPAVVVAALRERMLQLAARDAEGAFGYLVTAERTAWMRGVLDEAAPGAAPRPLLAVSLPAVVGMDATRARETARTYLAPYLRTANYQASWAAQGFEPSDWEKPGSDRLVDAMVAFGDGPAIERRIDAVRQAGADHVALIPLAPDGSTENLSLVESVRT